MIRVLLFLPVIYVGWELLTIPYLSVALLRGENPTETALMVQRSRESAAEGKELKIDHRWIDISRIPPYCLKAIVVAEDGMFYSHGGLDWFEIRESLRRNFEEGRAVRGASTITQQLAKNLYLSTDKSLSRKAREAIITFLLEQHLSKERILELYVNLIEWGDGIFGIESASRRYFGKSAAALTLDESVRLAAVIPSPLRYRPDGDSRFVRTRSTILLNRMGGR